MCIKMHLKPDDTLYVTKVLVLQYLIKLKCAKNIVW